MKYYSIIIPVFNEAHLLDDLIKELKIYIYEGHEVIIVDDGSDDGSFDMLSKNTDIRFYNFIDNRGKGEAVKKGLLNAKNEKIIIFDGDFELHPKDIRKLMILDENIKCTFAKRKNINTLDSIWNIGNRIISKFFNLIYQSNLDDALCCAKSFFKSDIDIKNLKSKKFDIDIEIASVLIKKYSTANNIAIDYKRRSMDDGKKLKIFDSFSIIKRIIEKA